MKNLISLLIVFLLGNSFAFGKHLSPVEAEGIAHDFFAQKSTNKSAKAIALAAQSESYYVYNRGENAGFVIVAADDAARSEVLGYADSGTFTAENAPEPLRAILAGYDSEYKSFKLQPTAATRNKSAVSRPSIKPLITSKWGQDWPYNIACPTIAGKHCKVGCVAVALGQVLRYHRMPEQPVGEHSYEWTPNGGEPQTLSVNFAESHYDWNRMPDVCEATTPTEQVDEVAKFLYEVGVACNMKYDVKSSGSKAIDAPKAIVEHFGCDNGVQLIYRSLFTTDAWEDIIYQELAAARPVIYCGGNYLTQMGHFFVCDGYQDGFFHVNLGGIGWGDGYYQLSAFQTADDNYSYQQQALIGVQKAKSGSKDVPLWNLYGDFSTEQTNVSFSDEVTFSAATFYLYSTKTTYYVLPALKVVPAAGGEPVYMANLQEEDINEKVQLLDNRDDVSPFALKMNEFPTLDGEYRVYAAVYDVERECYYDFLPWRNNYNCFLEAEVAGGKITFTKPERPEFHYPEFTLTQLSKAFAGKEMEVQFTGRGNGDDYADFIKSCFLNEDQTEPVALFSYSHWYYVGADGTFTVNLRGPAPISPGNYHLVVFRDLGEDKYEELSERMPITVYPSLDEELSLELASPVEITNSSAVDPSHFHASAQVRCTSGTYAGFINMYFFDIETEDYVFYPIPRFCTLSAGETVEVEFEADLTGYDTSRELYVCIAYYDESDIYFLSDEYKYELFPFAFAQTPTKPTNIQQINASERFSVFDRSGRLIRANATIDDVRNLPRDIYIVKPDGGKAQKIMR